MADLERRFREPPHSPTAGVFIRYVADAWGDRDLAVLGDDRLTFSEAERRSAHLAEALLSTGVERGTRLGILAPNGPEWVVAWLAATRIGAVTVLCNTYQRPRELGWILHDAGIEVLLTARQHLQHDYVERLEAIAPTLADVTSRPAALDCPELPELASIWMWADEPPPWAAAIETMPVMGAADRLRLPDAEALVEPDDPMVVIYTSGSTSDPKGVVHSHRGVLTHPYNLLPFRDLEPGDVAYTPMPLFWVGGLTYTLISCMYAGATVVFEERFDPGPTLDLLESERVTHVIGWPHMGKALTEHASFPDRDLSAVRGGSVDALLPAERRAGDPELRANSLGMTESLGPHSIELIGSILPADKRGSFGRSVPGVEHRIVDPVSGEVLPIGEFGEIQIRGYSLLVGLVGRDRDEVFTDDGWLSTGDGGLLDQDGHLYFKGRMGNVIKSGGMNVTPREVELVIEQQPEVMHAFIAGIPDPDRGETVAAAVVVRPGHVIDIDQLTSALREDLSSYKIPRHVAVFESPQDLPWLESGKIDLRAVREVLCERFATAD